MSYGTGFYLVSLVQMHNAGILHSMKRVETWFWCHLSLSKNSNQFKHSVQAIFLLPKLPVNVIRHPCLEEDRFRFSRCTEKFNSQVICVCRVCRIWWKKIFRQGDCYEGKIFDLPSLAGSLRKHCPISYSKIVCWLVTTWSSRKKEGYDHGYSTAGPVHNDEAYRKSRLDIWV